MQTTHKKRPQKFRFIQAYDELAAFLEKNKRFPSHADDPHLFNWLRSLKLKYRLKRLNSQQIGQMDNLGFVFNGNEERWLNRARTIRDFLLNCETIPPFEQHRTLHKWLSRYMYLLLLEKASPHKKMVLEQIRARLTDLALTEQKNAA